MRFLNPFFLYFLPIAFIPMIIYLIEKIKRKKIVFSSLELLEEILKDEKKKFQLNIFLKQLIKVLILALIILSFSNPIIEKGSDFSNFAVVIDPTLSMADFDIREIINFLREKGVKKFYFGNKEIEEKIIYEKNKDLINLINSIPENKIVLITDGQKSNFKNINYSRKDLTILLLKHTNTNYFFKNIEIFPEILTKGSELYIKAILNSKEELPIFVYLNDKLIYEERTKILEKFLIPDQSILLTKNRLTIKFNTNDFQFDNEINLNIYFMPKMKIFMDLKDISIKQYIMKTMRALFGDIEETFDINTANIAFVSRFDPNARGLIYTIPDNFENQKVSFIAKKDYSGDLTSELNLKIENFSLKSVYEVVANIYNLTPVVKLVDKPVIYRIRDNYIFTFSIKENLKEVSSASFFPIFFYETIKNFYNPQEKHSISEESVFEFFTKEELKKYFKVIEYDKIEGSSIELFLILLVIAIILFLFEIFN
ncbi:MAG: BatA domain-containing protein [Brevinematales bacterium]